MHIGRARAVGTRGPPGSQSAYAGRLAAKLFVAAGILTLVNNYIPPVDHLDRGLLTAVGISAIALGAISWILPWRRWDRRTTLILGPIALVLISVGNLFGGVSAYSYGVYFVVVFVYIGMTQPPYASLFLSPLAAAAYVVPSLVAADRPAIAALSATVAIPVCVLVGEVIARVTKKMEVARTESERRADLLAALAWASRNVNVLDADVVLRAVVDAALDLGFDAAEIAVYDDAEKTHSTVYARGLPSAYTTTSYPIDSGIAGRVHAERQTVVVEDYARYPSAIEQLRDVGFRAAVSSPVWAEGRLVAALSAGTRTDRTVTDRDLEGLELLAAQAGRALENAKRFETQRDTVEHLAELDRLKEQFISNISHELRTPLTVITGTGETLATRWNELDDGSRADLLHRLNRNAGALDDIISTLLDFSRLDAGRLEARLEPVRLGELCGSVASRLCGLFEKRPLKVSLEVDPIVQADPALIERVIENLLANAAAHTPEGTRVTFELCQQDATAVVSVSDDGPGIPAEDLERIGDRFFRGGTEKARKTPGTGLGLAFSSEVLRLHGSQLDVESEPGAGVTFRFALAVAPEVPVEIASPSEDGVVVPERASTRH